MIYKLCVSIVGDKDMSLADNIIQVSLSCCPGKQCGKTSDMIYN